MTDDRLSEKMAGMRAACNPAGTSQFFALMLFTGCSETPISSTSASNSTVDLTGTSSTGLLPTTGNDATTVTDASPGATSSAETAQPGQCGDGVVEDAEECDDGNAVNADGCNLDCKPSGGLRWEYRSGIAKYDQFTGVSVTEDARIFVGGAQIASGSQDRWIAQFSAEGELVWSKTYDETNFESVQAIGVNASRIYAAGMTQPGMRNLWVGALDFDGTIVWEDEFVSDFGDAFASGLSLSPDGDIVVAGLATVEGGNAEIWTRRYGPTGTVQWTEGAPINDVGVFSLGPAVSASADKIVVGFRSKPGPTELLLAYPATGGVPLFSLMPPMSLVGIYGVAQAPGGDILITSYGQKDGQMLVRRLDSVGALVWTTSECTANLGTALAVDSVGDIVVIGGGVANGGDNIRLCKFSPEGKLRWGADIDGGDGNGLGNAIALLPDDSIVAAGQVAGGDGLPDAWLAVYSP